MEVSQTDGGAQSPSVHIVMLPSPGMGHLIPLLEFAKRLLTFNHHFTITFAIPSDGPPTTAQISVLCSLPPQIRHVFLPPISLNDLPLDSRMETIITLTVARSVPSLRDLLESMVADNQTNLVALVVDHFCIDALDVGKEFNLSSCIFFPSTAMALSANLCLAELDEMVTGEYRDHPDLIRIPGCTPIHGRDLFEPTQDRQNQAYKLFLQNAKKFRFADGIFVNSFPEFEPGAISALKLAEPPIYPIGPVVKMDKNGSGEGAECLNWLDEQPHGSVLYVSFGSGGTLSSKQTVELAMGLEMSGERFLWIVRSPNDELSNASYFSVHSRNDPLSYLPEGFVERVKGSGLLVPSWAPQTRILKHRSTGGFLSHCGNNSVLESVVNGVPLIAWPLYAEQRMNAVTLTEEIKVALRPKVNEENGFVEKEEIAKVVKSLFKGEEGKKVSARMKQLQDAAIRAVGEDGSSTKALRQALLKWKAPTF
ncbi:hydroquinone glucosyltransferase-like [Cucurbita pepo subsp. pepo]|uniref:hydroquinone glucosyltransferase-like n=1 Tax=Cucurbita pepo subsp. pepo TaxID=3664 RepID=UPI000C9D66E2|nr:hydroquinone glucosyltransferase-like [Cucurbita pepo subsp. pepo]XP_023527085.1 hydroquinone glucosyltransferase-like [Cucurbita pepo subsp. pepo]